MSILYLVVLPLFESENVQVVGDGYRIADIVRALEDRKGFAEDIEKEAGRYTRRIHIASGIGCFGVIVLAAFAWMLPDAKAVLLGLWTAWTLLLMGLVIAFNYIRKSLHQSEDIMQLDDSALRESVSAQATGLLTVKAADTNAGSGKASKEGE